MRYYDAAVIGGGVLGCFAARNLRRWNISTVLIEGEGDVCNGVTRSNTSIVYAGYDNKVGSIKAEMTVRGNAAMEALCAELEVPFHRCGSLMVSAGPGADRVLRKKFDHGIQSGVPGLRLISGEEAREMEPMLASDITTALHAPSTGTVNPWQLGIAAYENAQQNGAEVMLNTEVRGIQITDRGYLVETGKETYLCKTVLNCAGLFADKVQELAFEPSVRLNLDGAEYLVFDSHTRKPSMVIFHQAQRCGKGITAIPCVEGNLLISGVRKDLTVPFATTPEGLRELHADSKALLPDLDLSKIIRSFGAVRPNPCRDNGESIHDYSVENPNPGFYSLIGVKTPGLTCANELGMYLAEKAAAYMNAETNPDFDPKRSGIQEKDNEIICQCERISKAEILEAIRRGATTVDAVKRRVGSGMGRCQGSRCGWEIEKLLEDAKRGTV